MKNTIQQLEHIIATYTAQLRNISEAAIINQSVFCSFDRNDHLSCTRWLGKAGSNLY